MTAEEIIETFNRGEHQHNYDFLKREAQEKRESAKKLLELADSLERKASKLVDAINKEQEQIADQLDIDFPQWRRVLVNELKNRK